MSQRHDMPGFPETVWVEYARSESAKSVPPWLLQRRPVIEATLRRDKGIITRREGKRKGGRRAFPGVSGSGSIVLAPATYEAGSQPGPSGGVAAGLALSHCPKAAVGPENLLGRPDRHKKGR